MGVCDAVAGDELVSLACLILLVSDQQQCWPPWEIGLRSATFDPFHAVPNPGWVRRKATPTDTSAIVEGSQPSQGLWPQSITGFAYARFIMNTQLITEARDFK